MAPRVENLCESTQRVVRLVALGHLADATAARERLADKKDPEALHDFRVALRRLRSWERAFRPWIKGDLSKKLRRQLRDLAGDTGASRDLEVHIAWLTEQRRSLGRTQRVGLNWLMNTLQSRKSDADAVLENDVQARFSKLRNKLERALSSYRETVRLREDGRVAPPPAFADALAPRVRDAAESLRDHLARVQTIADDIDAHEARISAKRLRYLLEPVARAVPGAPEVIERLKSLQDVLGDLHDAQVFGAEIAELAEELVPDDDPNDGAPVETAVAEVADVAPAPVSADPTAAVVASDPVATPEATEVQAAARTRELLAPDPMPGVQAISTRLSDRATAAFYLFANDWLGDRSSGFFRDLDAVADYIGNSATAGLEIERKYLLRFVPDEARDGRYVDIAQGYVPGERLHERIRRVTTSSGNGHRDVRYYRTVKTGEGVTRTELEEETTETVFETMWPLTRGHRLRKRRFAVDVDGRTWEIDEFRNRDLVLAEIELGSEDEDVVFPDWLAPAVQREVTTEPEFQNINLAR
jgi:CHAD domain-containing protein/CYTH domain-containing protein